MDPIDKFFTELARTDNVLKACQASGLTRAQANELQRDYAERWENARLDAHDAMEEELRVRAMEGRMEPVIYQGGIVYRTHPITGELELDENFEPIPLLVPKVSDSLLLKLVEAKKPFVFHRDHEAPVVPRDTVAVRDALDITKLNRSQRELLRQFLDAQDTVEEPRKLHAIDSK